MAERRDVTRSKEMIRAAYFRLRTQKYAQKITVKDIIEEADISRGTFYAHYRDIPDLDSDMENQIAERCRELLKGIDVQSTLHDPGAMIEKTLEIMDENKESIDAFVDNETRSNLAFRLKTVAHQTLIDTFEGEENRDEILLASSMVASAVVDACLDFTVGTYSMSREDFVRKVSAIVRTGVDTDWISSK